MAEVSREVVVMVESSKVGRKIPNLELPWVNISTLITDDGLDMKAKQQIEQHGVQVVCAAAE